jgi:hypothetical protein
MACQEDVELQEKAQGQADAQKTVAWPVLAVPVLVNHTFAVADENGKLLIPFEGEYQPRIAGDYQNTVWAVKDEAWWLVNKDATQVIKASFSDESLGELTQGYFWFSKGGKYGIVDAQGNIAQPAEYDEIYTGGDSEYIVVEVKGKAALMNARGEILTEAVYDEVDFTRNLRENGGLVMARRDGENWVINTQTKAQQKASYAELRGIENGYIKTYSQEGKFGLADLEGNPLIPAQYVYLGTPAEGLLAYVEDYGASCGYMDLQGKSVIPPKFSQCRDFGKKGAFAQEKDAEGGGGKYGLIDREGKWVIPPKYDHADEAGVADSGFPGHAPGYASIATLSDLFTVQAGLFDTDKGVEIIAPQYAHVSVLTENLLRFSKADSPQLNSPFGVPLPTVGIMDRSGKALLDPAQFTSIGLDDSGQFIVAVGEGSRALFDLNGKELIAPEWPILKVDVRLNVIFAYQEWQDNKGNKFPVLRAAYALDGKPLFSVRETACGAEQLLDGEGKVVWPQDEKPFCRQ